MTEKESGAKKQPEQVSKEFYCAGANIPTLVGSLVAWYNGQNLEVQTATEDVRAGHYILQCRTKPGWRRMVGMGNAVNIEIWYQDPRLSLTLTQGPWINVAVAGAAGTVGVAVLHAPLLLPLAGTAAVGWYRQSKLPDRTFSFVEDWTKRQQEGHTSTKPAPGVGHARTARDYADDYNLLRAESSSGSEASYSISEDDLVTSDFEAAPEEDFEKALKEAAPQPPGPPCPICGSPTEAGGVVCPKGHRLAP
ncbi:hypothetical protein GCM10010472_65000 [Pseudonocardia halophobica]|uniref:Zinc ribbon domain-containing protein n=1 Tax=Pseudonocardia halophobica TaxID=29401 RepID=A0A9W6UG15_9PSEU|nr:hypothetical protein GCM10017577_70470 [Pseudonocardia halophobica]